MSKTKYQRGLCVWHGCKNVGTITPNPTQRFCQKHWDALEQEKEHHEKALREIRERTAQKQAEVSHD